MQQRHPWLPAELARHLETKVQAGPASSSGLNTVMLNRRKAPEPRARPVAAHSPGA